MQSTWVDVPVAEFRVDGERFCGKNIAVRAVPAPDALERTKRAAKAGGAPAVVTAGIAAGAAGVAGEAVETKTDPVARAVAGAVGADPHLGPALLVVVSALILVVAFVAPGLFDDAR